MGKFKIVTTRTLTHRGEATWPDAYGGMTLEEAVAYESEIDDLNDLGDLMLDQGTLTVVVDHVEIEED